MNAVAERVPVLGQLRPQRLPHTLGSPFMEFESGTGVHGLGYVAGNELHLLSVVATTPGRGQFREFMTQCQRKYAFIRCWTIMNPEMRDTLGRYGFTQGWDVDKFAEMQEVWDWKAPAG